MILVKPSYTIITDLLDQPSMLTDIERAGRTCYKSEDKITDTSAAAFVKRIIKSGHHSVIEHANLSIKFIVDRGVTHEIVRHRLAAYSQESTRYCNYKGGVTFVIPPWVDIEPGEWIPSRVGDKKWDAALWYMTMRESEDTYIALLNDGWSPQQARSVLPNSLKTEIVMTANIREWRHVLTLRCSKAAHPQMQEIMRPLLRDLQDKIPILFEDITY